VDVNCVADFRVNILPPSSQSNLLFLLRRGAISVPTCCHSNDICYLDVDVTVCPQMLKLLACYVERNREFEVSLRRGLQ
jgi:hypothetical protein